MAATSLAIKLTVEQKKALADIKEFTQHLGNIAKVGGIVSAALGALGVVGVGGFIKKALGEAMRAEEFETMLDAIAARAGYAKTYIDDLVKSLREYDITGEDARQMMTQLIATELGVERATKLANAARDVAIVNQSTTAETMQAMIEGSLTLQSRMLRSHKIYVSLEEEIARVARARGKDIDAMSLEEKQSIALDAAIKAAGLYEGTYASAVDKSGTAVRRAGIYVKEMFDALGKIGLPALKEGAKLVGEFAQGVEDWAEANGKVLAQEVAKWVDDLAERLRKAGGFLKEHHRDILMWAEIIAATAIIGKIAGIVKQVVLLGQAIRTAGWLAAGAAGPIGIIAALVAGIVALWIAQKKVNAEYESHLTDLVGTYNTLIAKENKSAEEKDTLKRVTKELNDLLPDSVAKLSDETTALEENAKAQRKVITEKEILMAVHLRELEEQYAGIQAQINLINQEKAAAEGADVAPHKAIGGSSVDDLLDKLSQVGLQIEATKKALAELSQVPATAAGVTETPEKPGGATGPTAEEIAANKENWAKLMDEVGKIRMDAIANQAEREKAQRTKDWYALDEKLRLLEEESRKKGIALTPEQTGARLNAYYAYTKQISKIDKDATEESLKTFRDADQAKGEMLLAEVQYRRDLHAWDARQYRDGLQRQLSDTRLSAGEREAIEKELVDANRRVNIDAAEAIRDLDKKRRDDALRVASDIKNSFVDTATTAITSAKDARQAWDNFGKWLKSYFVRMVLADVMNSFASIGKKQPSAEFIGPQAPQPWWKHALSGLGSLLPFLGGAQAGMDVRTAGYVKVHPPEVISPIPTMREAVRAELAAAGAGGGVQIIIEKLQAWDAPSVLESVRVGVLGQVVEEAVARGKLLKRRV